MGAFDLAAGAVDADGPIRVVIDTDAANEIDDQFALAWALSAPDRIKVEAIHAAPFAHGPYLLALAAAHANRAGETPTSWEKLALDVGPAALAELAAAKTPAEGMELSIKEIERVLAASSSSTVPPVIRGSEQFMKHPDDPVASDAAANLIELVHASDEPLYVAVIGAPTNVAAALRLDPTIAAKLVVIFVAGYPSASPHVDESFNLVQDRHASNVLLADCSGLLYIPGYQVAETLSVSLPELTANLSTEDPMGKLLIDLYRDNPMASGQTEPGHSWIVWDLAPIAWLIDRAFVPSFTCQRATIGNNHRWQPSTGQMVEAYRVDRRAVYRDFFQRLGSQAQPKS